MGERLEESLDVEEVAAYLGVGRVTVYRWCREDSQPCLKIGRRWRIRRQALADFFRKSERSETLAGRLGTFLEVPDNVIAIAQGRGLMHRMDAAFFPVGEAWPNGSLTTITLLRTPEGRARSWGVPVWPAERIPVLEAPRPSGGSSPRSARRARRRVVLEFIAGPEGIYGAFRGHLPGSGWGERRRPADVTAQAPSGAGAHVPSLPRRTSHTPREPAGNPPP